MKSTGYIWIGRWRWSDTIYAKTAASTKAQCQKLIDDGPFHSTKPSRFRLIEAPVRKRKGDPDHG